MAGNRSPAPCVVTPMKLLSSGVLVAVVAWGCAGRQPDPAPKRPAARPAATQPVAAAQPSQAAPRQDAPVPQPVAPETAPPAGQTAVFVPSAADEIFVRRMLDVIDEIAALMEKHQSACDRMASELELVMRRNQDLIGQAKGMKGNPARDKWLQDQAMPRLNKALPRMMTGLQNCQNDTKMQALMRQLAS